jgi:hypothetical protein
MPALHLPIADPCHEDWEAMDVEAKGRFCGKCTKSVHDLSSMEEDEARALLRARAGSRICVRYEHGGDGAIRFRRPALLATALAGVALAACTPHDRPHTELRPTQSLDVLVQVPAPISPSRIEMGDVPAPERIPHVLGEVAPELPEPVLTRKGDVAVPNEPCDPPVVAKVVEPEPVVHVLKGKPMMPSESDL